MRASRPAARASPAAGAPLAEKLAALLKDPDELVRMNALQSISILGPNAQTATSAVIPLLDDPETAIDAADALGRIGTAAQPAPAAADEDALGRSVPGAWAAVPRDGEDRRARCPPGGGFHGQGDAHGHGGRGIQHDDLLCVLGPGGAGTAPAIMSFQIKNPVLPSATLWAINPDRASSLGTSLWEGGAGTVEGAVDSGGEEAGGAAGAILARAADRAEDLVDPAAAARAAGVAADRVDWADP